MQKARWLVLGSISIIVLGCSSNSSSDFEMASCTDFCSNGLICASGLCKRPVLPGGSCLSSDAYCVGGNCIDGACVGDGTNVVLECSDTRPCDSKYLCQSGICVPQAHAGENCGAGIAACIRGECENGKCVVSVGPGQSCDATAVCPESYECSQKRCLRPVASGGSCKSSLVFCKNGECREGLCYSTQEKDDVLKTIDSDGDTIVDYYDRCDVDTDGDTIPNCHDLDSDGDTIPDNRENYEKFGDEPTDSDNDGVYDFLSLDSDGNGIPDAIEGKREVSKDEFGNPVYAYIDTDGDTILDSSSVDNDGDGLTDIEEIYGPVHPQFVNYTDPPMAADCNSDTIPDPMGTLDHPVDCDGDTIPDYLSFDSDGDTIGDAYEFLSDSDNDGFLDRYEQDSDNDGVSDRDEKGTDPDVSVAPFIAPGNAVPDFQLYDTDGDALGDGFEVDCGEPYGHSKYHKDTDGDGDDDASEYAAAMYAGVSPKDYICHSDKRVKDVFNFYFSLPYEGEAQSDNLVFEPTISKLDVVFNVDTTISMGAEIDNLKQSIKQFIVPQVRQRVKDTAFGVTRFDDFPTRGTPNSVYDYNAGSSVSASGYGFYQKDGKIIGDLPFERMSSTIAISDGDDEALSRLTHAVDQLALHDGGDTSESGFESLWQVAMGDDSTQPQASWRAYDNMASFQTSSLAYTPKDEDRWGGAQMRKKALPVVLHITDATSHDADFQPYDPAYVENPHYSTDVYAAYAAKGARIVSIFTKSTKQIDQLVTTSKETNAYVPACAFRTAEGAWRCGEKQCCTINNDGTDVGTAPVSHNGKEVCVLSYAVNSASNLSNSLVDGIDALVKYSDFSVTTVTRGLPIEGTLVDTSCFIKRVEAIAESGYIAPPLEPEKSCNPIAEPFKFGGSDYDNAYKNFAVGTSSDAREGAKLTFKVVAQNDHCVEAQTTSQVFQAYIDVIDASSQVVLGSQIVSIIVPGVPAQQIN